MAILLNSLSLNLRCRIGEGLVLSIWMGILNSKVNLIKKAEFRGK